MDAITDSVATCAECRVTTCTECRKRAHPGGSCHEDEDTQQLRGLARERRWQQCPSCHQLVEKMEGCKHMRESPHSSTRPNLFFFPY